ncbi:MAG: hypothetical protein E7006_01280 [Alphaproteobacteria bacterium]|nr:hypothetical protein [Alphaproteobacteria bacterium]
MKKLIIFALSLFVVFVPAVLTPTVSYACEDTGDCDVWVNWTGQIYGSKEDCESDASSGLAGGCEGVGGSVGEGWDDEEDSGSDADGYFYCCGTNMGEFTSLSSCNDECFDGWCGQGASWEEVCDSEPGSDYDTSDPCAAEEVVDQNDCLGLTVYDEYGWAYSCTTGDEGSGRCATDMCVDCGGHDFEINCDYLKNFVVGVNLGTIYVDTSDCGEYSPSFLKVCESDDLECQNHMQINACAYSSIIRGVWGGEDTGTTLNLTDVNMYANEQYGASCYVPIAGLLGDIECSDNYANVVIDAWWGPGYYEDEYSDISERRNEFCLNDAYYTCEGDSDCEDYVSENESEHCKKILAALDSEYNTNGGDEEAAASTVRNYISDYMANNCPTNDEECSYLKAAFDYYNTDSCASPCEDGENGALSDVCSQFGASGTVAYNKCIKALNGTSTCNAIVNYIDIDCTGGYFNNFDAQDLLAANGMSCYFDTTRTDGYNCVLLAGFLNSYYNGSDTITCSANEETDETECYGSFSKYPSDTQKYLNKALQDAVDSGRVDAYMNVVDSFWDEIGENELQNSDRMSYWLDKAANELGINCKPLCNYEHLFNEIDEHGYTDAACNYRNFNEAYSDPLTISRVLLNCEDYNELYNGDWYDENNIATYLGCYNGEHIDDVADDNCEFADVWYNYMTKSGSDYEDSNYCNLDEICGDAYQPGTADYYRCKYNLNFVVYPGDRYEFEERCMNYWYDDMREDYSTTLQNFRNRIGLTCADSCGERQYNKHGQCYDCELPTSKYEDFVNWTPGSTKCAHTYDTIENAGLKIYDLKCELADDFKNWDCTYNALECGGGYYDASGAKFQDGNYADYDCNGYGFDSLGRPLCVYYSSWDQTDCADYDADGNCLVGLDFYYPYDFEQECNGSDWSDELDGYVYSCESTISARAIDMMRCDTPVPKGYYGLTNFSQEGWNGTYAKQACSVGDYQDETGKTSCKDCPAYGVKSTTNVTVYGTTESTASTDIGACKIPSTYSFKGGHGTYKFNPSCSYSK